MLVHKRCRIQCGQCCSFPSEPVIPGNPPPRVSEQAHAGSSRHPPSVHGSEQGTKHIEFTNAQENDQASPALGLEHFHLLRVIGRGSYSKILLVQLRNTDQTFAMKVVKKGRIHSHRAETERRVLQQVVHHPFLVGLHAYLETQSKIMFVLDYVSGGDIMFHLQRKRTFPEAQAKFYCGEIALAVNHLHQHGILYRNLKLDNILLDPQGHIKITDFCVSKEGMGPRDLTSTLSGTANYLAPEIIREVYGFSVDWWALGVIAFEMMVGESPFVVAELPEASEEKSIAHLLRLRVESRISIPGCLSVEAASVLHAFLNKDPKQRLGCRPPTGLADIQNHPFFHDVDWDRMEREQVSPPFQPSISGDLGLHNFDCVFTQEPVQLTPDENGSITEGSEVSDSEYISCPSMDEEWWDHFPTVPFT
ncbi:protein kinase C iota type-like [Cavia porcellus]|uniref:protein kinase C iota type-like n=1 Tax=Cavia porcellus TaxID=10141 RepID=UPI002FE31AA0